MAHRRIGTGLVVASLVAAGCSAAATPDPSQSKSSGTEAGAVATPPPAAEASPTAVVPAATSAPSSTAATTTTVSPFARPQWLGSRLLTLRSDGFGEAHETPPELTDRRLATPQLLPPPASGAFEATLGAVPSDVLARSSWNPDCPIGLADLAYITVSHVGFDGGIHTGEMIVAAGAADDIIGVFAELFAAGFPIEEMRVITAEEIDAPRTGDGNVTTSFSCRPAVNSANWSQHTYGLAIDINPFHNPYLKGDLVIPELASFYLDRDLTLPGMVDGTVVVDAFAAIGWKWGGNWSSLKDWMHFSANGH